MAYQQSDLDQLTAAIASGVKSVTFADGRKTEYQSVGEMRLAREDAKAEIAAATNGGRRRRLIIGRIGRR